MVYTLNGPGPLRGLPSLSATDDELGSREVLAVVDRAIERFGLGPGKRFMAVVILGLKEINPMVLRALKTRGFSIVAVTEGATSFNPALFDSLIVENNGSPGLEVIADAYVLNLRSEGTGPIEDPPIVAEAGGVRRFLRVHAIDGNAIKFLRDSRYSWVVQEGGEMPEVNCV